MPGGTADGGQDPLFDEVIARLPLAASPDQIERLVVLALRMLLRRDEDREQLEGLSRSIHDAIDQGRRRAGDGEFDRDLHRLGEQCARLLEAARRSQQPRQTVLDPKERGPSLQEMPAAPARRLARLCHPAAMMMALATLLILTAAAIAIDPLLAPDSWRSPPAARLTAAKLAREITAVPTGDSAALEAQGIETHLMRLADDRPLVMVDNLPRRLCPKTALLLARRGDVTLFDHPAPDAHPSTLASLCHSQDGDARLMWVPSKP